MLEAARARGALQSAHRRAAQLRAERSDFARVVVQVEARAGVAATHGRAAELLATALYTVVAPDFRGHGRSPGLRGYLASCEVLLSDAVAIIQYCRNELAPADGVKKNKCFLVGSSMGGTIALAAAQKMCQEREDAIAGVALLAPMLQLSVSAPKQFLLNALSYIAPLTWQIIPSSSTDPSVQYRDEEKRKECEKDEYAVSSNSKLPIGSALTCVELTRDIQKKFSSIETSLLIMVADEDVVVSNKGSFDLYKQVSFKALRNSLFCPVRLSASLLASFCTSPGTC